MVTVIPDRPSRGVRITSPSMPASAQRASQRAGSLALRNTISQTMRRPGAPTGPVASGPYVPMRTSARDALSSALRPGGRGPGPWAPARRSGVGGGGVGGGGGTADTGIGYSGGAVSALGTGVIAEAAPAPPIDFDAFKGGKYAGEDAAYVSETAAANAELQTMLAELARQNSEYETGFKGNLKTLGLDYEGDDWKNGKWDQDDTLGAYGQSYQNLQNDYSGRGLMDSTFYGNAQRDLTDRFNRQRDELFSGYDTAKGNFATQRTRAEEANKRAQERALVEAYSRYVGGFAV